MHLFSVMTGIFRQFDGSHSSGIFSVGERNGGLFSLGAFCGDFMVGVKFHRGVGVLCC